MLEAAQCRCPQFDAIQIVVDVVKHLGLGGNNDTFSLLCHHVATRFHSRNCCFHAVQESVSRSSFSERRRFLLFTFPPCLKAFFAAFFAAFTAAFITAFFSFFSFLAFLLFFDISRLRGGRWVCSISEPWCDRSGLVPAEGSVETSAGCRAGPRSRGGRAPTSQGYLNQLSGLCVS